jgi:hypothetical protein
LRSLINTNGNKTVVDENKKVEPFLTLNSFFNDRSTEAQQTQKVRQSILQNQKTSGAIVMVIYQVNITALTSVVPQQDEAVIVKTKDGDRFKAISIKALLKLLSLNRTSHR